MKATSLAAVPALRSSDDAKAIPFSTPKQNATILTEILARHEAEILTDWMSNMGAAVRGAI